jgi:hypothetical protein
MKKVLATILALVMALGLTTMAWAADEGPDMNGTVVNVTSANAQDVLDGKYGSIDGKTIHFAQGTYEKLYLARVIADDTCLGSGVDYYKGVAHVEVKGSGSTCNPIVTWTVGDKVSAFDGLTTRAQFFVRTVKNVTFTAEAGATFAGFEAAARWANDTEKTAMSEYFSSKNVQFKELRIEKGEDGNDLTSPIVRTNYSGSWLDFSLQNITFDGLTINGSLSVSKAKDVLTNYANDGIIVRNCSFNPSGEGKNGIELKSLTTPYQNVQVTGCTFTGATNDGLYIQRLQGATIKNNSFKNISKRAIQLNADNGMGGNVIIQENYIDNCGDRAIRFGTVNSDANVKVNNNVIVNSAGDESGQLFKANRVETGGSVNLDNNYWSGKPAATAVNTNGGVDEPTKTGIAGGTFKGEVTVDMLAEGVVTVNNGDGTFTVRAPQPEQTPPRYYYHPTTDTKTDEAKGSPKTFDAGIALYVGMALTSAAGVAFVGKKRGN